MEVHGAKGLPSDSARRMYDKTSTFLDHLTHYTEDANGVFSHKEMLGLLYAVAEEAAISKMSEEEVLSLFREAWKLNHEDWKGKHVGP